MIVIDIISSSQLHSIKNIIFKVVSVEAQTILLTGVHCLLFTHDT